MDSIIVSVDDANGSAYRALSAEYKKQFNLAVNVLLKKIANSRQLPGYKQMLDEIGREAEGNGLTPDILDEILNENS